METRFGCIAEINIVDIQMCFLNTYTFQNVYVSLQI